MLRSVLAATVIVVLTIAGLAVCAPGAAAAGTLSSLAFTPSSTATGDTGVSFTYSFVPASSTRVDTFTFTVPAGTSVSAAGGVPTVSVTVLDGTKSAVLPASATFSAATQKITVSFGRNTFATTVPVSVVIGGLKNPTSAVTAASTVTTLSGATAVDQGTTAAVSWTAATTTGAYWSPSSVALSGTGVTESYGFTTTVATRIDSVRLLLPPGSTATSPSLVSASPAAIGAGGSLTLSGQWLTYAFPATDLVAGTAVSLTVAGLTNPSVLGSYRSIVTTQLSSQVVGSAVATAVTFAPGAMTALSWTPSTTRLGASNVSITAGFTVGADDTYDSFVLDLPPGTTGTPTLTSLVVAPAADAPASPTVSLADGQLVIGLGSNPMHASAVVTLEVGGLTNTSLAGSYAMAVAGWSNGEPVVAGTAPAVAFTATSLTAMTWSVDSTKVGATSVSSTVGFGISGSATLTAVTMSVPPSTGGSPAVGAVTPTSLAGGHVALSGQTLTYTLPASVTVPAGTVVSVQITGLTNTPTPQTYASTVTLLNGTSVVSTGVTPSITFTSATLSALSWGTTSTGAGAASTYTFGFTTATDAPGLSSVTMTVPAGTAGTPALGVVSAYSPSLGRSVALAAPGVSLSGTRLTVTWDAVFVGQGTQFSIQITGLTNTSAAGSYTSAVTTRTASAAVDSGTTPAITLAALDLGSPGWVVSSTATARTGVSYTFTATPSAAMTVRSLRMTVPTDTAGTPAVGAVTPAALAGGAVTLSGGTLTYALPTTAVIGAGTAISVQVTGLTNTATAGSYATTITAVGADGSPVASGTASVAFTSTVLTGLSWTPTSTYGSAAGVSYTYGFTTASTQSLTGLQLTLPANTGGTPVLQTLTVGGTAVSGTVALSASVLTVTFGTQVSGGTFALKVGGLTNPPSGTFATTIETRSGSHSIDSGATPTLTFTAPYMTLTPPPVLRWTAAAQAGSTIVDTVAADQGYSVVDATGAKAGWNVTVSATTFSDGTHTLPDTGTFSVNGSLTSATAATAPAVACATGTCTAPVNNLTYPVQVTTAASAPPAVRIFSAAANSGSGSFTIGGSTSSAPIGWWVHLPATVYAGTYTSTITFSISSGP